MNYHPRNVVIFITLISVTFVSPSCNNKPNLSDSTKSTEPAVAETEREPDTTQAAGDYLRALVDLEKLNDSISPICLLYKPGARAGVKTKVWKEWLRVYTAAMSSNFDGKDLAYCGATLNPQIADIIIPINEKAIQKNKKFQLAKQFLFEEYPPARKKYLFNKNTNGTYKSDSKSKLTVSGDFLLNSELFSKDSLTVKLQGELSKVKEVNIDQFSYTTRAVYSNELKAAALDITSNPNIHMKEYFQDMFVPGNLVVVSAVEIYGFQATIVESVGSKLDAELKARLQKINTTGTAHINFSTDAKNNLVVSSKDTFTVFVTPFQYKK